MYVRCPNCRTRIYVTDGTVTLTERQVKILNAIDEARRKSRNGAASTLAIAQQVSWSTRTVLYELSHLEHLGEVARPPGRRKSGWLVAESPAMLAA